MRADLTAEFLRSLLSYDPTSGEFRWLVSAGRRRAGDVAGCSTTGERQAGRRLIGIGGVNHKAHRLAWLYMTGHWPSLQIDHIDGDQANNRWANLRQATNTQNGQNRRRARSDSRTGMLGVTLHKPTGAYRASIKAFGKRQSLGYFSTAELAHSAYVSAKRQLHDFNTI